MLFLFYDFLSKNSLSDLWRVLLRLFFSYLLGHKRITFWGHEDPLLLLLLLLLLILRDVLNLHNVHFSGKPPYGPRPGHEPIGHHTFLLNISSLSCFFWQRTGGNGSSQPAGWHKRKTHLCIPAAGRQCCVVNKSSKTAALNPHVATGVAPGGIAQKKGMKCIRLPPCR